MAGPLDTARLGSYLTVDSTGNLQLTGKIGVGVAPTVTHHVKASGELARFESTSASGGGNGYITFNNGGGRRGYLGMGTSSNDSLHLQADSHAVLIGTGNNYNIGLNNGTGNYYQTHANYKGVDIGATGYMMGQTSSGNGLWLCDNIYYATSAQWLTKATAPSSLLTMSDGFTFYTAPSTTVGTAATLTARARLNSSSQFAVGNAAAGGYVPGSTTNTEPSATITPNWTWLTGAAGSYCLYLQQLGSGGYLASFMNGSTAVGSISTNGSSTSYNTTSDRRLKLLSGDFTGSGEIIDRINVHLGRFNGTTETLPMFVADELEDGGAAFAVTGDRDAVKDDGAIDPQMVDHSKLVPILWAELRDVRARLSALESSRPQG